MRVAGHVAVASITYNQKDYVSTLVNSVENQDYDKFITHHIVDDYSTDGTSDSLITSYMGQHHDHHNPNRFLYINQNDHNLGSNRTFDLSILSAMRSHPEYISFLEGDDYYHPEKIRKSVEFMLEKGYDAVATDIDADCYDGRGMIKNAWKSMGRGIPEHITYEHLSYGNCIYTCTFVAKREVFNDAPTLTEFKDRGYGVMGDYPLFLWIAKRFRIGYLDEALSVKRELPLSLSHNPETHAEFVQLDAKVRADAQAGLF